MKSAEPAMSMGSGMPGINILTVLLFVERFLVSKSTQRGN